MRRLISVHVAKAGGSSLLLALQNLYGAACRADYAENPADPRSPRWLDPIGYTARRETLSGDIHCVHGHFHPGKYDAPKDTVLATILRHPIDNIISIFAYWKTLPPGNDPLHDYFLANRLTLLQTARLPLLRRLFCETYFGGFDMARFDVIGRHETRADALARISTLIGGRIDESVQENVTPPDPERQALESDPALRHQLEDILADDLKFYERHAG
jgi:hypothetical protein